MGRTIFNKIISKEIPADILYESEMVLAFRDIKPKAPIHILIIPKSDIPGVTNLVGREHSGLLGEMFDVANKITRELGINKEGFRLVINSGIKGGQEVQHLHIHLLGGRQMNWPPG